MVAKASGSKKKKPRLPGMEEVGIKEIDAAAGDLIAANSERGQAFSRVKAASERLMGAMKKHKKEHYKCDGIEAWIDHGTEKAKAKEINAPDPEDE